MSFPFMDRWRPRRDDAEARAERYPGGVGDPAGLAEVLGECALLRGRAADMGVELDDAPESLSALDQLPPRWRDDPQEAAELGHDAGLYLGSVIVASVAGASWELLRDGRPFVRLASGRELDVAAVGRDWAAQGAPSLWQVYSEADEG
ncbi:DUF6278 family protein [Streptacidiphilus melanogenes]|uniref:DUF6278 family protein n=1 Tax=Streptacidiphilus melanogenes TaxID=411235 RepID=UPI0005A9CF2B|nr:DUF6278 family protein [Streptacidiphilus melanogenes]